MDWSKKDYIPLLFILDNKNIVIDGVSNANIKDFSIFPNEEEVFFFSFLFPLLKLKKLKMKMKVEGIMLT